ncbi:MAG: PLP-dependent aminotransferase family protein [Desulfofustis sp.]|nr:PLP-dependent aminotransferase family protein [Desulfofustis sp.]
MIGGSWPTMDALFSDRIRDVPRSFIREILKVTMDRQMISFAGGLPNRQFFPVQQLQKACERVFAVRGGDCLQYSNSEGLIELRRYIARRYKTVQGISLDPDQILITNGSQQALDLIAKATLNDGDPVIIEEPGYLGAIQALSLYRPAFLPVAVDDEGIDVQGLANAINSRPKMMYTVPNFQNPSGISYSQEVRKQVAGLVAGSGCLLIEDDPYGALRFKGTPVDSFFHFLPGQTILLGSFSKIVVPGFRLGWVAAPETILEKLLVAKQASDLHTCNFTQYVILEYLHNNDIDGHIKTICDAYGNQCRAMIDAIEREFPADVHCTRPEGGMFLWGKLPEPVSSLALFDKAVERKVVFVPGEPFYTRKVRTSAFRLNFSCVDESVINDGIARLAEAIRSLQLDQR